MKHLNSIPHREVQMGRFGKILKSKTFWGGVAAAVGVLTASPEITFQAILQAGGIIIGAIGLKDASVKVEEKVETVQAATGAAPIPPEKL